MTTRPQILGGRYEVGELLGRGGMAEVHIGHDTRLSRPVAIKLLRSELARDGSFLARFRREAQSAAGLNHASIVAVYDSGEDRVTEAGGATLAIPYIVMEYVEGKTLRELLSERSPLEPQEAARITEGVLEALAYSHRMGIVHRDIKPANVMVGPHGEVKVMDFGIARAVADANATMTQTQAVIGTAQYLSPEQAQGQNVDARSDLYSTGCLLFELITGRPPFLADSPVAIAYQHVGEPAPRPSTFNSDVDASFDAVVLHALTKDREARYQDATSFRADLQAARLGRPISAAARGTAAAVGGSASTVAMRGRGGEATLALGAGGAAVAAGSTAGADEMGLFDDGLYADERGNTATLPAIGHDPDDEPHRRRGLAYVLLVLAVLGAITLLGLAARNYLDRPTPSTQQVSVPSLIDLPVETAEAQLRALGLVPDPTDVPSQKEVGLVVDQNPQPKERVAEGSKVSLSVSAGPDQVSLPDLRGFTEDEARTALSNLDLSVGATKKVDNTDVEAGRVVSTSPAAGETVAVGSAVTLNLSSGLVQVPNVVGKPRSDAATELSDLGFRIKTTYAVSRRPEDEVLRQSVKAGEKAQYGSQIELIVAQPAPPTPTPTTTSTTTTPSPTTTTQPPTRTTTTAQGTVPGTPAGTPGTPPAE